MKLGFRDELAAIEDPQERMQRYDDLVARAYERGAALNAAVSFAVEDVIDPFDACKWIMSALRSVPPPVRSAGRKRRNIDTW